VGLHLENLRKEFGELVAVKDLTLTVETGEFVSLLGPSGCGKSTTLNMIAGLLYPTSGRIFIDDIVVNELPPRDRKIGLVFQNYAVFNHMTVYDNLAFGLKIRKTPKSEIDQRVKEVAEFLRIGDVLKNRAGGLRLDQLQRVAIGRSMIVKPTLFLLDEPLSNLDAALRAVMRVELKKMQKELKQTVMYVTHDQLEAMTMCERIAVMNKGELQQYDTPTVIYNHPKNRFVANFIGSPSMNFIDCSLVEKDGKAFLDAGAFTLDITEFHEMIKAQATSSELVIGVRPEHIEIMNQRSLADSVKALVYIVEPLGARSVVSMSIGNTIIKALTSGGFSGAVGETKWIRYQRDKIHIIDKKTGKVAV